MSGLFASLNSSVKALTAQSRAIETTGKNLANVNNTSYARDRIGNILTVAMGNPLNQQAIEDIEMITRCTVQVFVSTVTDVTNAIKRCYRTEGGR